MLDINFIRNNSDAVKKGMQDKGIENTDLVDHVLETDEKWRSLVQKVESLRSESNRKAKEIGNLMSQDKKEEAQKLIEENSEIKEEIQKHEEEMKSLKDKREELLYKIPNLPDESVPVGRSEEDNKVHDTWGDPVVTDWQKPHWELAEEHGWIDFDRGSKVSGAGYPFYLGRMAKFQRALITYFLQKADEKGYRELQAPYFVNEDSARGTGQIPDKEDMMYVIPRDDLYVIPTAEVPVTNFHRDEILDREQLPVNYSCFTPCWRREAGSHGADVRGLNRLHQFDKVELVKIVHPDQSYNELERLKSDAESLLQELELPYRTLLMCTGDMGFTQAKKYDLEVWSPAQERWLEVSSCSNFEAYQARRMQIRYKDREGNNRYVHTLNGSGLALPRVLVAILENYQTREGEVKIPEVLQPIMGDEWL